MNNEYLSKSELFGSVIGLCGLGLNHDRGVASLVKLRFVGDRSNHIATVHSHRGAECRECRNQHREDDFDDFGSFRFHNVKDCFSCYSRKTVQR